MPDRLVASLVLFSLLAAGPSPVAAAEPVDTEPVDAEPVDLVIYGGTAAAVTAAVQARDDGLSVVVVSPDEHLGGLSSGGLGWTDSGRKEVIGGLARQFYRDLKAHYDTPDAWTAQTRDEYLAHERFLKRPPLTDDAMWVFEPHVAEAIFDRMIDGIPLERGRLDRESGVTLEPSDRGRVITAIRTLDGREYRGRAFLDATYEGDLMAAAGVPYVVGREANAEFGETINGVQTHLAVKHQFPPGISPYVAAGDPSSGLLPGIGEETNATLPPDGTGDGRVQAYNFRMCLTDDPANRVPFPKPDGYDPQRYELLGRVLDAGWRRVFRKFDPAPNRKTDTNNHGPFSTDFIGRSAAYPDASYDEREAIVAAHAAYQQGLMWFLANDPRVPADVRGEMSRWGLAADEFRDNGHWPHQIYVREARRMRGVTVMSEPLVMGRQPVPRPIGMGSYNMDSHNVQRYVHRAEQQPSAGDEVRNEGDVQISPRGSYPIAYGTVLPPQEACTNLSVVCAVSATHIAYGSIRMEPVFMILGQSAAVATAIALDDNVPLQQVPYDTLAARLTQLGQVLDHETSTQNRKPPESYGGLVFDTGVAARTGGWTLSSATDPHVGPDYYVTDQPGLVTFDVTIPEGDASSNGDASPEGDAAPSTYPSSTYPPSTYEVRLACPVHPNRATDATATVTAMRAGADRLQRTAAIEQRAGELFKPLATIDQLAPGDRVIVTVRSGTDGYTAVDAVQLIEQ